MKVLEKWLSRWLTVLTAFPEDPGLVPAPKSGSSQLPLTPAPGDLAPSSAHQEHMYTHGMYPHSTVKTKQNEWSRLSMVTFCNLSSWEVEARGSILGYIVNLRPAWATLS